jgi:hypothetical protein
MRTLLSSLLLLLASVDAYAQTPQVTRIDVTEYGIYTSTIQSTQAAPGTATGALNHVTNFRLAVTTRTVPAQQGAQFGFRFNVVGPPSGMVVPLHSVTILPPPGLRNPATGQVKTQSDYDANTTVGADNYRSYTLTHDWEVVPGIWTMQIWYQGRKLVEQSFNVVRQ